jgi:hypothetical protein
MDELSSYREIIKRILSQYVALDQRQPTPGVESLLIADDERGHYQLFSLGWAGRQRVRNCRVYVRLKDGKFWIEHDLTEGGIATDLLAAGVPNADIVLAFHAPELRQYSEFAAA